MVARWANKGSTLATAPIMEVKRVTAKRWWSAACDTAPAHRPVPACGSACAQADRRQGALEDAASTVSGQFGRSMSNVWASLIVQIDGPPMVGRFIVANQVPDASVAASWNVVNLVLMALSRTWGPHPATPCAERGSSATAEYTGGPLVGAFDSQVSLPSSRLAGIQACDCWPDTPSAGLSAVPPVASAAGPDVQQLFGLIAGSQTWVDMALGFTDASTLDALDGDTRFKVEKGGCFEF